MPCGFRLRGNRASPDAEVIGARPRAGSTQEFVAAKRCPYADGPRAGFTAADACVSNLHRNGPRCNCRTPAAPSEPNLGNR
jgi:hypothetical protein